MTLRLAETVAKAAGGHTPTASVGHTDQGTTMTTDEPDIQDADGYDDWSDGQRAVDGGLLEDRRDDVGTDTDEEETTEQAGFGDYA